MSTRAAERRARWIRVTVALVLLILCTPDDALAAPNLLAGGETTGSTSQVDAPLPDLRKSGNTRLWLAGASTVVGVTLFLAGLAAYLAPCEAGSMFSGSGFMSCTGALTFGVLGGLSVPLLGLVATPLWVAGGIRRYLAKKPWAWRPLKRAGFWTALTGLISFSTGMALAFTSGPGGGAAQAITGVTLGSAGLLAALVGGAILGSATAAEKLVVARGKAGVSTIDNFAPVASIGAPSPSVLVSTGEPVDRRQRHRFGSHSFPRTTVFSLFAGWY